MLRSSGVPYTSIRPVYIYGPLNYNPVEEWFFHRIKAGRPIPVPGSGMQVSCAHIHTYRFSANAGTATSALTAAMCAMPTKQC